MELEASALATELGKGGGIMLVIWLMLKDMKAVLGVLTTRVESLEKTGADKSMSVVVEHMKDDIREIRRECKDYDEIKAERIKVVERDIKAIWGKIGNRPEDLKYRKGECE